MEVNKIYNGTCLDVLKTFPDNSIDSCVTDPPYGISFMNKHWDYDVPKVYVWREIYRVLKPGAHLLCACGTRTQHRMAVNIEDAGFEIRDIISWIYGSGFPKSLDVSKAIDSKNGVVRQRGVNNNGCSANRVGDGTVLGLGHTGELISNEAISNEAKEWQGWGTALKPAQELWTLARKPLSENTVAQNVLKYGTGGINIDGSRVPFKNQNDFNSATFGRGTDIMGGNFVGGTHGTGEVNIEANPAGRFPANVIFDEFTGKILDDQSGVSISSGGNGSKFSSASRNTYSNTSLHNIVKDGEFGLGFGDEGGASRFFYCPKSDNYERNKGLKEFNKVQVKHIATTGFTKHKEDNPNYPRANVHPTVKPIDLMRYLVKLITLKGGICIDPYCGSGTTLIGCKLELINYIGIEREQEYCKISEARVAAWNPDLYKPQTLF